jgi:arginase
VRGKPTLAVIDCPSNLGLKPSGVERLPAELRRAGLVTGLGARDGGVVLPATAYDPVRDPATGLLNGPGIRATAQALATRVSAVITSGDRPLVLAGDCSVLLGGLLGLRQMELGKGREPRPGLLFVDGHVDFYQPAASPTGEVADMDLALATGRGPAILTHLDHTGPLVRDEDVVALGARDREEREMAGSQDVFGTAIHLFELEVVRRRGVAAVAREAVDLVARPELVPGFWLHLDADVLADDVMPAVDYRQPGGLSPEELAVVLHAARTTGRLAGVSIAIYNPALDPSGKAAKVLVDSVVAGLS